MFSWIFRDVWANYFRWLQQCFVEVKWDIGGKVGKDGSGIMKIVNAKMKIKLVQRLFYFLIYFSRIP